MKKILLLLMSILLLISACQAISRGEEIELTLKTKESIVCYPFIEETPGWQSESRPATCYLMFYGYEQRQQPENVSLTLEFDPPITNDLSIDQLKKRFRSAFFMIDFPEKAAPRQQRFAESYARSFIKDITNVEFISFDNRILKGTVWIPVREISIYHPEREYCMVTDVAAPPSCYDKENVMKDYLISFEFDVTGVVHQGN